MAISVLLCTHQPRRDALRQTLAALEAQTLSRTAWELLVIDNASTERVTVPLAWHPRARIVREERLGLTFARTRGIAEARGELLVFCDDDNLLAPDYLATAAEVFRARGTLGAAGGKALPRYGARIPAWFGPFADRLAVRDLGPDVQVASWKNLNAASRVYPPVSPIGAGMVLRRSIALEYAARVGSRPVITDRSGAELASGGDNDIVLTALRAGWEVGHFPHLQLTHLIPRERLGLGYLAQLNRAGSKSWVQLLSQHGLSPWQPIAPWTVRLRKARAFFAQRAWSGPAAYLQWAGACGLFEGRAKIAKTTSPGE